MSQMAEDFSFEVIYINQRYGFFNIWGGGSIFKVLNGKRNISTQKSIALKNTPQ